MALVATVSKTSVKTVMGGLYTMTFNMVLTDGDKEVLNKEYSIKYRTGDSIPSKKKAITSMMQRDIDDYKMGNDILKKPAMDKLAMNIGKSLGV